MICIGICFVRKASPQCTNQCAEVPILTAQEQIQNSTFEHHPCKYSFDLSPEAIVSANQGLFQAPLSLFWQGADIYSVTSVGNIVKWEKATVESSYNISSWDTAANSTFGYFVLYKHMQTNPKLLVFGQSNSCNLILLLDAIASLEPTM